MAGGGLVALLLQVTGGNWWYVIGGLLAFGAIGYFVNPDDPMDGLGKAIGVGILIVVIGVAGLFLFGRG